MSSHGSAQELRSASSTAASTNRRFAHNLKWQFVANGSQAVFGGAYMLVLGRLLGPTDFGIFSIVSALVLVAGLLLELRIQDVVARDFCHADGSTPARPDDAARLVDLFILEASSRALPALGLIVLAPVLAGWSQLPSDGVLLIVLAAIGFFLSKAGWGASTGVLRVLGRTDLIAVCLTADWGMRLVATAVSALFVTMSVELALVIALVSGGLCNGAQAIIALRNFSRRFGPVRLRGWTPRSAFARSRDNRRLIGANLGVSAADLMAKDLDVAMISSILPAEKVGLYKLAKSFAQMIWRGIDPFYLAIMPEVRRLWVDGQTAELKRLLLKTTWRLLMLAIVFVAATWVLVTLFGERVLGSGYRDLPGLMPVMCLWILVCAPLVWAHPLAVAINRPELAVLGGVLGSAAGLAAFWALTPALGLNGAALAWSLTTTLTFCFIAATSMHFSQLHRRRT